MHLTLRLISQKEIAIVSKLKYHFVIHHPKSRNAIENFIPPIVE